MQKQNVDVALLAKIHMAAHGYFKPFSKLLHMGESG